MGSPLPWVSNALATPDAPMSAAAPREPMPAMEYANAICSGDADASRAKAYPLQLANKSISGETAPYFVEWVRQQLDAQFGKQLYEQGLKVYTTLDVDLQRGEGDANDDFDGQGAAIRENLAILVEFFAEIYHFARRLDELEWVPWHQHSVRHAVR